MAIEEPKYVLINKTHSYEIRMYKDRLAVQTIKNSGQESADVVVFCFQVLFVSIV